MPLRASEHVFDPADIPAWVPGFLRAVLLDLTYWEFHAMELGLLGLFVGPAVRLGFETEVAAASLLLVGTAFGVRRLDPDRLPDFELGGVLHTLFSLPIIGLKGAASRTIHREPWYFLTVYVLLSVVSWVSFPVLA